MAKILLIEDEAAVRATFRYTLLQFGHSVTEARNGKEGLALLAVAVPDLLITDIIMPERGGWMFCLRLGRAGPPSGSSPCREEGCRALVNDDYFPRRGLRVAGGSAVEYLKRQLSLVRSARS